MERQLADKPELDAGDSTQVRKLKKQAKLRRERELEDMRQLLKMPGNRAFLWRLLEYCKMYSSNPFPDALGRMAMFEGRRMVGIWLLKELQEADPRSYAILRDEAIGKDVLTIDLDEGQ